MSQSGCATPHCHSATQAGSGGSDSVARCLQPECQLRVVTARSPARNRAAATALAACQHGEHHDCVLLLLLTVLVSLTLETVMVTANRDPIQGRAPGPQAAGLT